MRIAVVTQERWDELEDEARDRLDNICSETSGGPNSYEYLTYFDSTRWENDMYEEMKGYVVEA
jgi:hypothetical protein